MIFRYLRYDATFSPFLYAYRLLLPPSFLLLLSDFRRRFFALRLIALSAAMPFYDAACLRRHDYFSLLTPRFAASRRRREFCRHFAIICFRF